MDNLNRKQLIGMKQQYKRINEEKRLEDCRKRLDKIVSTKIRTSFIGAIAKFEESFGFLWGQGKLAEDLTEEEAQMRELWQSVRNTILNNGNNQLRSAQNEIANHVVSWNRHHMDLVVKPQEENNA